MFGVQKPEASENAYFKKKNSLQTIISITILDKNEHECERLIKKASCSSVKEERSDRLLHLITFLSKIFLCFTFLNPKMAFSSFK